MVRAILSVIVGYIVVFVVVFAAFTVIFLAMGPDRAFQPGTYQVSTMWIVIGIGVGLVAAILGGAVCALMARTATPPKVLAAIALVLGLLLAVPVFMDAGATTPTTRPATVSNMEAMMNAREPKISAILDPFIGAVGVLIGAAMARKKSMAAPIA